MSAAGRGHVPGRRVGRPASRLRRGPPWHACDVRQRAIPDCKCGSAPRLDSTSPRRTALYTRTATATCRSRVDNALAPPRRKAFVTEEAIGSVLGEYRRMRSRTGRDSCWVDDDDDDDGLLQLPLGELRATAALLAAEEAGGKQADDNAGEHERVDDVRRLGVQVLYRQISAAAGRAHRVAIL